MTPGLVGWFPWQGRGPPSIGEAARRGGTLGTLGTGPGGESGSTVCSLLVLVLLLLLLMAIPRSFDRDTGGKAGSKGEGMQEKGWREPLQI